MISIETLLDVNDLTVEEVTRRLCNIEQRKKNVALASDKQGRLLLKEEWLAHLKRCDNSDEGNDSPVARSSGNLSGVHAGKKGAREKEGEQKKESANNGGSIRCSNYGKKDCLSKDCWS